MKRSLSVSSIGTNELQPLRIQGPFPTYSDFQFPLSERTNCNFDDEYVPDDCRFDFQFPLSERTNCNGYKVYRALLTQTLSVSSIGTNELQRAADRQCFAACRAFSFLYRNERTATRQVGRILCTHAQLSVSSIGTNELQPAARP